MTDLLGFGSNAPNVTTTRPGDSRALGATDTWAKDCSSPSANDGTVVLAGWLNSILAQIRGVIRGAGISETNADNMLWLAVQAAAGSPHWGGITGTLSAQTDLWGE